MDILNQMQNKMQNKMQNQMQNQMQDQQINIYRKLTNDENQEILVNHEFNRKKK